MGELYIMQTLKDYTSFIYKIVYPQSELYGLSSQIRRAIVSVRLNIIEGNTFNNDKQIHYFRIALASLNEVEECLNISYELGFIDSKCLNDGLIFSISSRKQLQALINSLIQRPASNV